MTKKLMTNIPHEALDLRYNSTGFLPDTGIYHRDHVFYHGPSRSHFWLFAVLLVGATIVTFLPWHTRTIAGDLKYWIAGTLVFGGICDLLTSLVQRAVRQQISIDTKDKTVSIDGSRLVDSNFKCKVSWDQVIGLQICRQKVPANSEMNGYQLILVWEESDGTVQRRCLLKHAAKAHVARLGRRYELLFGFSVVDYSH